MEQQHYSSSDPRHVMPGQVGTIHNFKCTVCGKEESQYGSVSPRCSVCNQYSMKEMSKIEDTKVAEIKNRKTVQTDPNSLKKGRGGRFDDGLVQEMKGVVHPRSGGPDLLLAINMDKSAFVKGLIHMKWGQVTVDTSVYEIGAAFTPFDPTPTKVMDEQGREKVFHKTPKRLKTKIGSIEVEGGQNPNDFLRSLVTFVSGRQRAVFNMSDIAIIISSAL